ncbi:1-deoxy-D-xylulose-5-phosphate synthase N-terminal domain-containing protein [Nocardiopsis dassonvillei]|uniref:1-deoxy-D-xylulose-5-phosphate synthase N-terminal domain-containing protein n=1 Tax=Nocardiopsis dassonvillei TaxID=2014 RepID=UPI00366D0AB9
MLDQSQRSYEEKANELRADIKRVAHERGAHLGSPLGAVEIILALHRVFDSLTDRFIYDTGHQAYAHKLLTDRKSVFHRMRDRGGPSGFPSVHESRHDAFGVGHASTSIAAALGYGLAASDLQLDSWSLAIIGDSAFAGGESLEALNLIEDHGGLVGIVVNDNQHAISPAVGALSRDVQRYRHIADAFGLSYVGPLDGHDTACLVDELSKLKQNRSPFLLHARTVKGKGDDRAEANPVKGHAVSPSASPPGISPNSALREHLIQRLRCGDLLRVITPGMGHASGLVASGSELLPVVDTGITEPSAVTVGAAMAIGGLESWVHIYSTFLPRAADQILHDVGLQRAPVRFVVDRVGLCGADGVTHHGLLDLAILRAVPNIEVFSVGSCQVMNFALERMREDRPGPSAIRFSKGTLSDRQMRHNGEWGQARGGSDVTMISHGRQVELCIAAAELLAGSGISCRVIDAFKLSPFPETLAQEVAGTENPVLVVEEHAESGSLGLTLSTRIHETTTQPQHLRRLYVSSLTLEHGSVSEQLEDAGLSATALEAFVLNWLSEVSMSTEWSEQKIAASID